MKLIIIRHGDPDYKNEGVTRRRRKRAQYTTNNVNELIGIFERDPEQKIILRCPCCRQPREFELDSKIERYNETRTHGTIRPPICQGCKKSAASSLYRILQDLRLHP